MQIREETGDFRLCPSDVAEPDTDILDIRGLWFQILMKGICPVLIELACLCNYIIRICFVSRTVCSALTELA